MDLGQRRVGIVGVVVAAETQLRQPEQEPGAIAERRVRRHFGHGVGRALMIPLLRVDVPERQAGAIEAGPAR